MTTPQDVKETPVRREASFVEKITYVGIGALLVGGAVALYWFAAGPKNDDDERPPIIVRNGSVHFEVAYPASDGDKGTFEQRPQNQTEWLHKHTGKSGPNKFSVIVTGALSSADCPGTDFSAYPSRRVVLKYDHNNVERTISIDIHNGDFRLATRNNASVENKGHYLRVDSGARLKSIDIWRKKKGQQNETTVSCMLNTNAEIVFVQRK